MSTPSDKVLDRLAKLKAMRDGEAAIGNSEAADAFAQMINRMLLQHELSESEIPAPPETDPVIEVNWDLVACGVKHVTRRVGWQEALARIVARAHMCTFLVYRGSNRVSFVGTKSHATVAEYAFGVLAATADRMSVKARDDYWREHREEPDFDSGNYRAAWLNGFVLRIAERFREAQRAEVAATTNTSTALMRISSALARADDYIKQQKYGKVRPPRMGSGISAGQQAGREAADRIQLDRRGVGAGNQQQLK